MALRSAGTATGDFAVPTSPLSDWCLDLEAEVVDAPCNTPLETRLREIGLVPGVRVRLIRTGSRIVVQIGEGRVAMRREDAAAISVRPVGPAGVATGAP